MRKQNCSKKCGPTQYKHKITKHSVVKTRKTRSKIPKFKLFKPLPLRNGFCGKVKVRYFIAAFLLGISGPSLQNIPTAQAAIDCKDVYVFFTNEYQSDEDLFENRNYEAFESALKSKLDAAGLSYNFSFDYVPYEQSDGLALLNNRYNVEETYKLGAAVGIGARAIRSGITKVYDNCPSSKIVLAGYSYGALAVSKATENFYPEDGRNMVVYAATFGDPKLYLPEGAGFILPSACRGGELSDYRMYVPDCRAYKGALAGTADKYELANNLTASKVGAWCNKKDLFCSSGRSLRDHESYIEDGLYEDASRVIFDKIVQAFGIENTVSSPHDTIFLIDSTGSMQPMIWQYKEKIYQLAKKSLESGDRIALYDYRDLMYSYDVHQHCDFDTCTLESFADGLDEIEANVDGGGDEPESLLSASFKVMKDSEWRYGATKSLIVLTDASFLSPDRDDITLDQVVSLSKTIDPVNFYVVTKGDKEETYSELTLRTDGGIATSVDEFDELTDFIAERYDSLPRVEEDDSEIEALDLEVTNVEWLNSTTATIHFASTGTETIISFNDAVLGYTDQTEITLSELDNRESNFLTLTPATNDIRGDSVTVELKAPDSVADGFGDDGTETTGGETVGSDEATDDDKTTGYGMTSSNDEISGKDIVIPRAPNTGRAQ